MAVTRPRSGFGAILRRELDASGVSTRELARRLTAAEPDKLENVRRSLIRYINGEVSPGPSARAGIAGVLGLDVDVFAIAAVHKERRDRVVSALVPLADVLLELAVEVGNEAKELQ